MKTLITLIIGAVIWQTVNTIIYYATGESEDKTIPWAMGIYFLGLLALSRIVYVAFIVWYKLRYTYCEVYQFGMLHSHKFVLNSLLPLFNVKDEEDESDKSAYLVIMHTHHTNPTHGKINQKNIAKWGDFLKKPLDK